MVKSIMNNIFLILISSLLLLVVPGCSDNKQEDINIDNIEENEYCVFGSEETGYITTKTDYDYKLSLYGFLVYESSLEDSVVSFSDVSGMYMKAIESYKEKVDSDEDIDHNELENYAYNKLIDAYKESDLYSSSENYINSNDIEGTVLFGLRPSNHQSEEYLELLDEVDENVEKPISILFITKQCKIVSIYSQKDVALDLLDSYSYEGNPTVLIEQ